MSIVAQSVSDASQYWGFTREHNIETLKNLTQCFLPITHHDYRPCPPKPLIVNGYWYSAEVILGGTSGETIWQTGVWEAMQTLGMHIIAVGPYENWVTVAEMMPDV